jgi:RecB family exonuclease
LLAEERRLLIAAMGRARSRVLLTAVDSDGGDEALLPSPFCLEVAAVATDAGQAPPTPVRAPSVLTPSAVVGRLRAVVCAPDADVDDVERACAAAQLLRLADAGVPGADPAAWYAAHAVSSAEPLWDGDDHVVTLSPSSLQLLSDCPLRWLLERHGGSRAGDVRSAVGSLVHALVSDPGMSESRMISELEKVWPELPFDASWYADNERTRHLEMLATFLRWREQTRAELTEVGTEVDVDGRVREPSGDGPGVRIRGRIDRVERDGEGRIVVVDLKTGKSPVTKDDAQSHAQLAMYQLAVDAGLLPDGDITGGGRLVYLGKTSGGTATERSQDAQTVDGIAQWHTALDDVARATQGPAFTARINTGCSHCPVRPMCPAQNTGSDR